MNDRVPLGESPVKTEPAEQQNVEVKRVESLSFLDDIEYHRMSDLLEINYEDRKDQHTAEKIAFLADWAKEQTKSEDRLMQYEAIKNLSRQLGFRSVGKDLITKLYQWTRLDMDRRRLEREMDLIK